MKAIIPLYLLCIIFDAFNQTNDIYWKKGVIPICWESSENDFSAEKKYVEKVISETWERAANVKFTEWCPCYSNFKGVRIFIGDVRPEVKRLGPELYMLPNGVRLNFTFVKWKPIFPYYNRETNKVEYPETIDINFEQKQEAIKKIAVHEFGHILGFGHQQSRDDCKFYDCPFSDDAPPNAEWFTTCDRFSVMNYCNPYLYNDGQLSTNDKFAVQKIYGSPSSASRQAVSGTYPLSLRYEYYDHKDEDFDTIFLISTTGRKRERMKKIKSGGLVQQQGGGTAIPKYDKRKVIVFLEGSPLVLQNIEKVRYTLHPTFERYVIDATNWQTRFSVTLKDVWDKFQIKGIVYFKNGTELVLDDIDLIRRPTPKFWKSTKDGVGDFINEIFSSGSSARGKDGTRNN